MGKTPASPSHSLPVRAAAAVVLTIALAACRAGGAPPGAEPAAPAPDVAPARAVPGRTPRAARLPDLPMPRTATADDFSGLGSATRGELLARAGPPDARFGTEDDETFLYRRLASGKSGSRGFPEVRLQQGRVVQITFHPDEASLLSRMP